jgi:hypothetical protein
MGALNPLIACAGQWRGTNRLQDPHASAPEDSNATASVAPLLGGRFVRFDYTWGHQGQPQEGSLLIGFNPQSSRVSAQWIDSWHNGFTVMTCDGTVNDSGVIDVRGAYPAPPGPDWGWRTVITPGADTLQVVMHNIWPDGREELAVEDWFTRT